jgi:hypothetical protein
MTRIRTPAVIAMRAIPPESQRSTVKKECRDDERHRHDYCNDHLGLRLI